MNLMVTRDMLLLLGKIGTLNYRTVEFNLTDIDVLNGVYNTLDSVRYSRREL